MTFSIAGFCRASGQFGTAISSSSICAAARCPFVAPGKGAVLTQNVTNPALGPLGLRRLEDGLDGDGASAVHSGGEALGIHATRRGRDCVAGGDLLADAAVIDAMIATFESGGASSPSGCRPRWTRPWPPAARGDRSTRRA